MNYISYKPEPTPESCGTTGGAPPAYTGPSTGPTAQPSGYSGKTTTTTGQPPGYSSETSTTVQPPGYMSETSTTVPPPGYTTTAGKPPKTDEAPKPKPKPSGICKVRVTAPNGKHKDYDVPVDNSLKNPIDKDVIKAATMEVLEAPEGVSCAAYNDKAGKKTQLGVDVPKGGAKSIPAENGETWKAKALRCVAGGPSKK